MTRLSIVRSDRLIGMLAAIIAAGAGFSRVAAQEAPSGQVLYRLHCAACHGSEGGGNGPMARVLKHEPPDLTRLSRRNGGSFPAVRVRRIVEGRDIESHGDREMPIWGDAFRRRAGADPGDDHAARIAAILRYLESIQNRDAQ